MKKSVIAAAVAATTVAGAGGFLYFGSSEIQATPVAPTAVAVELARAETFEVRKTDLRFTVPVSGTLRAVRRSTLRSEVAAKVSDVLVQEGQAVEEGSVLVVLDTEDLTSKLEERLANLASAKAQLTLAAKNRETKLSLQMKGYAAQSTVDEVESAYRAAQANVRAMQAQVDLANKALDDAIVSAPMSGFVAERSVNPGDKVSVDGGLLTLVDLAQMEIEVLVPMTEIPLVEIGQEVMVGVPGFEDRVFFGTVERISPTTRQGSRSIPAYVRVENQDLMLRDGMFAKGDLVVRTASGALAVPHGAVRGDAGAPFVLRIASGEVTRQPVELSGDDTEDFAVVTSGLAEGDQVVSAEYLNLDAGTPVRISEGR